MASSIPGARVLIESRKQDALKGDPGACFDMGVAHSSGNLIEAHKWFDLAALAGYGPAEKCRANIAWNMSAREIAEARRRTRIVRQVARFSTSLFA